MIYNDNPLNKFSRDLLETVNNVMEATKEGGIPKTDKHKDLAAKAPPHDKITHADVLVGRGVLKKHPTTGKLVTKEEVEELDELSKKTLGSYVKKAANSMARNHGDAVTARNDYDSAAAIDHAVSGTPSRVRDAAKSVIRKDAMDREGQARANVNKRWTGIDRATSKLTKEEVEGQGNLLVELSANTLRSYAKKAQGQVDAKKPRGRQPAALKKTLEKRATGLDIVRTKQRREVDKQTAARDAKHSAMLKDLHSKLPGLIKSHGYTKVHSAELPSGTKATMYQKPHEGAAVITHVTHFQRADDNDYRPVVKFSGSGNVSSSSDDYRVNKGWRDETPSADEHLKNISKEIEGAERRHSTYSTNESVVIDDEMINEATLVHFNTKGLSFSDNQNKVTSIHKSLRDAHPDKVHKTFGGSADGGYVSVNNKAHIAVVKDHIRKAGGIINEALGAADRYNQHHAAIKDLLKSITQHVDQHKADALKYKGLRISQKGPNWAHVGDVANVHTQLADIHDRLAQQGEYKKAMVESLSEAKVDGVAAGSMDDDGHLCATKVFHKEWAEGTPIFSQHAEPDADGNIDWYDVMFEHGIEKCVMTEDLEILMTESHERHGKRKMKEDVESIDELSAQTKDSYVNKAVKQLPGLFDQSGKTAEGARKYYNRKNTVRKIANEDVELEEARGRPRKVAPPVGTDPDEPEPRQHIMQQLARARLSMKGGTDVTFKDGSTHHVPSHHAQKIIAKYFSMQKPADKEAFQKKIGASHAEFKQEL